MKVKTFVCLGGIALGLIGSGAVEEGIAQAQSTRSLYGMEHRWASQNMRSRRVEDYRRAPYQIAYDYDVYRPRYDARVRQAAYGQSYEQPYSQPYVRNDCYGGSCRQLPLRPIGGVACPTAPGYYGYRPIADTRVRPVAPPVNVTVQPPAANYRSGLRPGRYVGRGILGQPTIYGKGQPVRNLLRAFTP